MGGERQVSPEPLHRADRADRQGSREGGMPGGSEEDTAENGFLRGTCTLVITYLSLVFEMVPWVGAFGQ